jgi:hypothetical protein
VLAYIEEEDNRPANRGEFADSSASLFLDGIFWLLLPRVIGNDPRFAGQFVRQPTSSRGRSSGKKRLIYSYLRRSCEIFGVVTQVCSRRMTDGGSPSTNILLLGLGMLV